MSDTELLRTILAKWSSCAISLYEAETELRACLIDDHGQQSAKVKKFTVASPRARQPVISPPAPSLDEYLSLFDVSYWQAQYAENVLPSNYEIGNVSFSTVANKTLPVVHVSFFPK